MPPRSKEPRKAGGSPNVREVPSDATSEDGPRTWPVRRTVSAGGVVIVDGSSAPDGIPCAVLIRHTSLKGATVWGLPKGQLEPGESAEEAAVREVREETGLEVVVLEPLDDITYWFAWAPERVRYRKTVHFFLMRMVGGDPNAHDHEVEEVAFVPLTIAPKQATHSSERKMLRRAAEVVADR